MSTLTQIDKKLVATSLGISALPQETQDDILSRLEAIIISRLTSKVSASLTDDDRKKLETEDDIEIIKKYCKNFDEITQEISRETIAEFRQKISVNL